MKKILTDAKKFYDSLNSKFRVVGIDHDLPMLNYGLTEEENENAKVIPRYFLKMLVDLGVAEFMDGVYYTKIGYTFLKDNHTKDKETSRMYYDCYVNLKSGVITPSNIDPLYKSDFELWVSVNKSELDKVGSQLPFDSLTESIREYMSSPINIIKSLDGYNSDLTRGDLYKLKLPRIEGDIDLVVAYYILLMLHDYGKDDNIEEILNFDERDSEGNKIWK